MNPLLCGGNLLFGDFTLKYDASRLLVGGTGWVLTNNLFPAASTIVQNALEREEAMISGGSSSPSEDSTSAETSHSF